MNGFKFNYKGYKILCFKVISKGLYGTSPTWKIQVWNGVSDGPEKELLTKVPCNRDTFNWAILKGIELAGFELVNVPSFDYNKFFDEVEENAWKEDSSSTDEAYNDEIDISGGDYDSRN